MPNRTHSITTSTGRSFEFEELEWEPHADHMAEALDDRRSSLFTGFLTDHADFLYVLDQDLRFLYVNPALLQLWGLQAEQAEGRTFSELGYPPELVELHEVQLKLVFAGKVVRGANPFTTPAGEVRYYEYVFAPLREERGGAIAAVAGITRDVTHHKLLERERDILLSMIGHDLRTPLSVIATGAQLAAEGHDPELLEMIRSNAARAVRLVDDLLDSARIRSGEKLSLRLERVDLQALVRETAKEMEMLHGNRFTLSLPPPEVDCEAMVDPEAVQRMLANLASNAVKYGDRRRRVELKLERLEAELRLEVTNWGEPISSSELDRIFLLFAQGSYDSGNGQRGWGIGLAVVARLVAEHGGRIEARSSKDEGTRFLIVLPASEGQAAP